MSNTAVMTSSRGILFLCGISRRLPGNGAVRTSLFVPRRVGNPYGNSGAEEDAVVVERLTPPHGPADEEVNGKLILRVKKWNGCDSGGFGK